MNDRDYLELQNENGNSAQVDFMLKLCERQPVILDQRSRSCLH